MQWMNKSLHARMERVVEERQGTLMECGVKLGYSHHTTRCYWNESHLWLQRIPGEPQNTGSSRVATTSRPVLDSARDGEEGQLFPPIFIHLLVPGEIHIGEMQYDPSMVLDREIWTMIKKAHFESFKPCNRYMAILMLFLAMILFVYSISIAYFMYLFGDLQAWLGFLGIMSVFFLTWFLLDQWNLKTWHQVADQVTLWLLHHENPQWNGIALKLETSILPFRSRPSSRRYQLVRVPGNDPLDFSASTKNGNVDPDPSCQQDDEHHIL